MKTKHLFICLIFFVVLCAGAAFAAEGDEVNEEEPLVKPAPLPAGWMILLGRLGGGATTTGGSFEFDDVPRGADEKTSFGSRYGDLINLGVEAMFFPTQGRRFMLTASAQHTFTTIDMNFNNDEYGNDIGFDHRLIRQRLTTVGGGIGYRWLYGERDRHASTLYGKLSAGGANMAIDGVASDSGGAAMIDLGTNYFYRFDNRMIFGFQWDLRGWGAGYTETEFDALQTEGRLDNGGFCALLSVIIGWETL